ncbi:hypothetical protein SPACI_055210 [Sporomusa acidovorans DSM 3132]|uniref:Uncharacterized protein n=1 Tax=Sporomusa acidovorans (strain ATCC 49682 / DSM 3132 / Mol) TaxID=1123286 RepID=A0ABZ3JC65_SPOA4|nr:hypothetical protein SPACI_57690 [Sporomusa acidovorans DSM 3132]SDD98509.1 hypothetical protein SAMN04488499_100681 [Sporomusa acidovorans]
MFKLAEEVQANLQGCSRDERQCPEKRKDRRILEFALSF